MKVNVPFAVLQFVLLTCVTAGAAIAVGAFVKVLAAIADLQPDVADWAITT